MHYKTHTYTHPYITKPTHTHTHTLQNPHIHKLTYYKTQTYIHTHTLQNPHIHTPTHTQAHILQNPNIHTHPYITKSTHTYIHPHITKQVKTTTVHDTQQIKQPQYNTCTAHTYVFLHGTTKRIFINFPIEELFQHWPRHSSFSVNRTLDTRIHTRSFAHNAQNTKELFTLCAHFLTCFFNQFHSATRAR